MSEAFELLRAEVAGSLRHRPIIAEVTVRDIVKHLEHEIPERSTEHPPGMLGRVR